MSLWRTELTPERVNRFSSGTFAERLGIQVTEIRDERARLVCVSRLTMAIVPRRDSAA